MPDKYSFLRETALRANLELPRLGLVLYTFGNVSVADRNNGVFAIKPSGVAYDELGAGDMVIVDFDGKTVEGKMRPSSDTPTHAVLYRGFSGIGAVVHTHSTEATAWAQALRSVPIYGTTHADHLPCDIPCTAPMADDRIQNDYEVETGNQIVDCFAAGKLDPEVVQMVLVGSHGPFTWGDTPEKAVYNARVLEELCRMARLTEAIAAGKSTQAERLKKTLIDKHFFRKHGKNAYYGQENR